MNYDTLNYKDDNRHYDKDKIQHFKLFSGTKINPNSFIIYYI